MFSSLKKIGDLTLALWAVLRKKQSHLPCLNAKLQFQTQAAAGRREQIDRLHKPVSPRPLLKLAQVQHLYRRHTCSLGSGPVQGFPGSPELEAPRTNTASQQASPTLPRGQAFLFLCFLTSWEPLEDGRLCLFPPQGAMAWGPEGLGLGFASVSQRRRVCRGQF